MCASDVYRFKRIPEVAPKKQLKLRGLIHEEPDVETMCACAHLEDAVECLSK